MHPGWVWRAIRPAGIPGFGNLKSYVPADKQRGAGGASYFAEQMDTHGLGHTALDPHTVVRSC
jgi:(S)-mandelate dehydrogenase